MVADPFHSHVHAHIGRAPAACTGRSGGITTGKVRAQRRLNDAPDETSLLHPIDEGMFSIALGVGL